MTTEDKLVEQWEEEVRTGKAIAEDGLPILFDEWMSTNPPDESRGRDETP